MASYLPSIQGLFGNQSQIPSVPQFGQQSQIPSVPQFGQQSQIPSVPQFGQQTSFNEQNLPEYFRTKLRQNRERAASQPGSRPAYVGLEQEIQEYMQNRPDQFATTGSEGWLSGDEMRAKTNALQTSDSGTSSGGMMGAAIGSPTDQSAATNQTSGGLLNVQGLGGSGAPGVGSFPNFQGGSVQGHLPGQQQFGGQGPSGFLPGGQQQPGPGSSGQVPMQQVGPQDSLNQYYNTPGYQLTEGQGAVNQFQTSPGYQFAVDEAMKQVQGNAASRGLLDSGAALRSMTDRAQNMANQEYSRWQNRQQQMFGGYQDRLAGLAGGPTGAEQAFATGQGQGATQMQTGSDVASLLANQGSSLFGGITGTGGAQAQNVMNAGNLQAQILSGNRSTQLGAATAGGLF